MPGSVVRERSQRTADKLRSAVRVLARAAALDEPDERLDLPGGPLVALVGEIGYGVRQSRQAEHARPALASGLAGQVAHHAGRFGQAARGIRQRDNDASAEGAADGLEIAVRQ